MKIFSSMLIGALLLSSCAKDGSSSSDSNNCSQATIDAYNGIVRNAELYNTYSSSTYLSSIKSNCTSFKSLIGTGSCKATVQSTGGETTVSYSGDVKTLCDALN